MPVGDTLAERFFYVTVHLTALLGGGKTSVGTGFIYRVRTSPTEGATFVVTNKHVVVGAQHVRLRLHRAVPDLPNGGSVPGGVVEVDIESSAFVGHPDPEIDVCVAPFQPVINDLAALNSSPFHFNIGDTLAPDPNSSDELNALEEILFIGYPNGLFDTKSYLPIARRGTTASDPRRDYEGKPIFLIDASVFPGSSGSPVLVYERGAFSVGNGPTQFGTRTIFLGVVASVYQRQVPVLTASTAPATPFVNDLLNIGIVYKTRTIDETCDLVLTNHQLSRYRG